MYIYISSLIALLASTILHGSNQPQHALPPQKISCFNTPQMISIGGQKVILKAIKPGRRPKNWSLALRRSSTPSPRMTKPLPPESSTILHKPHPPVETRLSEVKTDKPYNVDDAERAHANLLMQLKRKRAFGEMVNQIRGYTIC